MRTALHVSPHPDDESIGAPCTLVALKETGWRVINLAVSLGRPHQAERRQAELAEALAVAGIEGWTMPVPAKISSGDDLDAAQHEIARWLGLVVAQTGADLIVGPHPEDGHHGHEVVGRAIREALVTVTAERDHGGRVAPVWWMWSIWRDLRQPTLVVGCSDEQLNVAEKMLTAHTGENNRNDYLAMLRPQRRVNAVRGAELVFGFGAEGLPVESAELLTEVRCHGYWWQRAEPRVLDRPDIDGVFSQLYSPGEPAWSAASMISDRRSERGRWHVLAGTREPWSGVPQSRWPSGLMVYRPLKSARRLLGG